jgi:hypothetical protein
MRTIAELDMLLRARATLPDNLKLATDEFREGWSFVRTGDARRLGRKMKTRGWNFIKIADALLRSGVGDTSQDAVASALKLALRGVNAHCNAVEVEHIELTQYPWFFLARVRVDPYCIQQEKVLPVPDEAVSPRIFRRPRQAPLEATALSAHFGSAMPQLKQMLISSPGSQVSPQ